MAYLKVSGVDFSPYVNKMTTDYEPIWNTSAGRTLTTDFVGRIIGYKWKLNIGIKPLSQSESAKLHKALRKGDFVTVQFIPTDQETDALVSKVFYVSSISNPVYSYANGFPRYSGMSFNLIQQ